MSVKSCRVTIKDLEDVAHTVEVLAETLYEAVAQGLAAIRRDEWVAGIPESKVRVSVGDVRVEHEVNLANFTKWLDTWRVSARSDREKENQVHPGNAVNTKGVF